MEAKRKKSKEKQVKTNKLLKLKKKKLILNAERLAEEE